ncbi:MAG: hypothetical protein LBP28_06380 [Coriobacteriales bacterium]|jgi:hypothetical protein|nr:hypothetical protein [Coriobacteriales bacterium]
MSDDRSSVESDQAQSLGEKSAGGSTSKSAERFATKQAGDSATTSARTAADVQQAFKKSRAAAKRKADFDATLSYAAVGEPLPEFPFASRSSEAAATVTTPEPATVPGRQRPVDISAVLNQQGSAGIPAAPSLQESTMPSGSRKSRKSSTAQELPEAQATSQLPFAAQSRTAREPELTASSRLPAERKPQSNARKPQPNVSPRPQAARELQAAGKLPTPALLPKSGIKPQANLVGSAAVGAVAPVRERDFYNIRGGGSARVRSPLVSGILAIVVLVGIVVIGSVLINTLSKLMTPSPIQAIVLTTEQTRSAIDSSLPLLTGILDSEFDAVQTGFTEQGLVLFSNSRYNSDTPDPTAQGRELVRMPKQVSDDFMTGFYEGGYSAYSLDELQAEFNGTWTLDMTRGDLGSLFKLKYANLNASSLADEMDHLALLQGLAGDGVNVVAEGTDSRGNTVRQGTRTVEDVVFYWRIAACPFSAVYGAAAIGDSAVYISISLATYDFYTGAEEIK